jgi:hypothetical protein
MLDMVDGGGASVVGLAATVFTTPPGVLTHVATPWAATAIRTRTRSMPS